MNYPPNWGGPTPPWYSQPPNTVFVPVQMPPEVKGKKEKKSTIKGLGAQIKALEELKKSLEGDKDKKKDEKKKEIGFDDLCREVGKITLFGPTLGLIFYEIWMHIH
jgi:hypothetical protein